MRKRISCRVIRSIALGKSSDALRDASRSDDKPYETRDVVAGTPIAKTCVREDSHFSKYRPATYIDWLGIARVPTDDGLTAPILDFYV